MNLTEYSVNELSMVVMNNESLYNMRFTLNRQLLIDLGVRHTQEQWDVLAQDLREELYEEID